MTSDTTADTSTAPAKVVLVTGAATGIGALTVRELAAAGHTVYAGMRDTAGRDRGYLEQLAQDTDDAPGHVAAVDCDVTSEDAVQAAVDTLIAEQGHIDVVVHNAGHMALGPTEAFAPHEVARILDINVLGHHRVNRAVLPHLRRRGRGLLVWVGSSSTRGGHTPFISAYFAAKAAMDSMAVDYADELIRFGIDSCIVVPGAFTSGTRHFDDADHPADTDRAAEYDVHYGTFMSEIRPRLAALAPVDSTVTVADVARTIAEVIDLPRERRPFRIHIDPNRNGSEVVSAVADRVRADFYRRLDIADLLPPNPSL